MEEDANPAGLERSKPQGLWQRHKTLLIILSILIALFGVLTLSVLFYTWDRGRIARGVTLEEIPLGQLSLEEAEEKLSEHKKELYQRPVQFTADNKSFQITLEELGFTYSYDEPLQQAYLIGREGNIFNKAISKFKASRGITFEPDQQWKDLVLKDVLTKQLTPLNLPAEDAYFSINPDNTLQIVPEKLGKQVDLEALITKIKKEPLDEAPKIPVPFKTLTPILTQKDLEVVKTNPLLSEYTTRFNPGQIGRTYNIKLAAKTIDGTVVVPGKVFSFNQTVGPRTVEAGYQEAIIIEGKKFVPGLGGGVCQVSSTLYNAVRLASPSLTVIERSPHSLPVTYVPLGQDATVAYPYLDFKFRNDSKSLLLIRSGVKGNALTFSIYGPNVISSNFSDTLN